ncbi:MAG: M28 family peptidase, partial [bacterium]|nr:M28 family peptidase [bacterium]
MRTTILLLSVLIAAGASASPLFQAVPCEGYKDAYEYARDGIEVVAVGAEFCIVRYDSLETAPLITAGAVELGPANRDIYIVESYLGQEWSDVPGTELLARFGDSYIVAVEPRLLATNWAGQFEIRKVHDRPIQPPRGTQDYPPIEKNPLVREMVSRLTARDYGEFLEGLVDETPSRFSYSPLIKPATSYIRNYYNSMGLNVDLHQYEPEWSFFEICTLPDIFWLNEQYGWIASEWGIGWRTTDGGNEWDTFTLPTYLDKYYFLDEENGFALTVGIYGTDDGGLNWSEVIPRDWGDYSIRLDDIDFVGGSFGATAGTKHLDPSDSSTWTGICYFSDDGGENWRSTEIPTVENLYSVSVLNEYDVWVGGYDTSVYRSDDGGYTFIPVDTSSLPADRLIKCIHFFSQTEGVIAGSGGLIAYTEDGGTSWVNVSMGTNGFSDMYFADSTIGWVCGGYGMVYKTTDGGRSWVDCSIDTESILYSIHAISDMEIWVSGRDMALYKSDDGGSNWQPVELPPLGALSVWENVIGELPGKTRPEEIYIICAHYDSTSDSPWYIAPGAEDNGSGTAGVLHLAKIMSQYDFASTIRFCTWSGEEEGLEGSYAYAAEAFDRGDDIRAVYNMDMIAYMDDDTYDSTVGYIQEFEDLLTSCLEARDIYVPVLELFPETNRYGSDQASFWEFGYPAIYTIEYGG